MDKEQLRRGCILSAVIVVVFLACTVSAQLPIEEGRRVYDEQLRVELDRQQSAARQMGLDAGGWFSFAFFDYEDAAARKERTLRQYELRLWANYTVSGVHTFYFRGKMGYDDWNSGDNPDNNSSDDFNKPDIERAWYRFDYDRLVSNQTGQVGPAGFTIQVGRDFYDIGSGLVLAMPLDAVKLTGRVGDWTVDGLLGQTIVHDTANIDNSASVSNHMDRCFYGIEVKYSGFDRHEPYAYYLWTNDHTEVRGHVDNQEYSYDSRYFGMGSRGSIEPIPNLRYETEIVFQSGRSFPEGVNSQEKIDAMAIDVMLEYLFPVKRHPRVAFEYLWGSGDSDRRVSSTSTIGGNQPGTRDRAFGAFGYRDTGLAFAPAMANLHIFQLDCSVIPLEDIELFRKMEVGTKAFFYTKDARGGAISDTQGAGSSSWVGWEWDTYVNWRLTSDVSLTVRYGLFFPGAAFQNEHSRHFFYTGLTYSF
ncbi:MAG: alginate export family protein [Phycisphaerae bacterium]|nr:alginate export family protein [Phycisphaerae bacterium]